MIHPVQNVIAKHSVASEIFLSGPPATANTANVSKTSANLLHEHRES